MATRCRHRSCNCDAQGKDYCSTHCSEAERLGQERDTCDCGHAGCRMAER